MARSTSSNVLVQLQFTGDGSFNADADWRKRAAASFCPHCGSIYENVDRIDVVVLPSRVRADISTISPASVARSRGSVCSVLFGFAYFGECNRVRVISTRLIELVGLEQMKRVAGLGRMTDTNGKVLDQYRTAVARRDSLFIRGYRQSGVGLCKECGRLLWGPGGEGYVLRRDLPPEPFFLSDGDIFCTDEFWNERLFHARLTRVEAIEIPIREEPEDGLPKTIRAVKARLKAERRFK